MTASIGGCAVSRDENGGTALEDAEENTTGTGITSTAVKGISGEKHFSEQGASRTLIGNSRLRRHLRHIVRGRFSRHVAPLGSAQLAATSTVLGTICQVLQVAPAPARGVGGTTAPVATGTTVVVAFVTAA